jgi:hypothetical protein
VKLHGVARQLQQCLGLISQADLLKMVEAPGNNGLGVQRRDVQKGGFSTLRAASNLKKTGTHLMSSRPVASRLRTSTGEGPC